MIARPSQAWQTHPDRLVQRGDTLVIVEHHPWVIAGADYVVELAPSGGAGGGKKIAEGSPKEVAKKHTATGDVLAARCTWRLARVTGL